MKHKKASLKLVKISLFLYVIDPLIYKSCSYKPKTRFWKMSLLMGKIIFSPKKVLHTKQDPLMGSRKDICGPIPNDSSKSISTNFSPLLSFLLHLSSPPSSLFGMFSSFLQLFHNDTFQSRQNAECGERFDVKKPKGWIARNW